MSIYVGYIYLWFDTKAKLFYVGGHKGLVEDSYICSSPMMLRAYKKRPHTFKFRVLEHVYGNLADLRIAEQRWLDLIQDHELYWTENIKSKTVRYYNQKKLSSGGNGQANRGKKTIGGHNKGKPMSEEQKQKISRALKGKKQTPTHIMNRFKKRGVSVTEHTAKLC